MDKVTTRPNLFMPHGRRLQRALTHFATSAMMGRFCKRFSAMKLQEAMGQIIIDGHRAQVAIGSGASVAEAFEAARDSVLAGGRVVVEVELDDVDLTWGDGAPVWQTPFSLDAVLELHSADPVRLCASLLENAAGAMKSAAEGHRSTAEALRTRPLGQATDGLLELLACWQNLQDTVTGVCSLLGIDPTADDWKGIGAGIVSAASALHQRLGELKEAADTQDYVLVADLLEYELAPLAEQWRVVLQQFGGEIERRLSKEGDPNR